MSGGLKGWRKFSFGIKRQEDMIFILSFYFEKIVNNVEKTRICLHFVVTYDILAT